MWSFCFNGSECRGFSFFKSLSNFALSRDFAMGAFELPTVTKLGGHIIATDNGGFYDIDDGLP